MNPYKRFVFLIFVSLSRKEQPQKAAAAPPTTVPAVESFVLDTYGK